MNPPYTPLSGSVLVVCGGGPKNTELRPEVSEINLQHYSICQDVCVF